MNPPTRLVFPKCDLCFPSVPMVSTQTIYRAPPNSGELQLGRTLPSLLDDAIAHYPNAHAFNQWHQRQWQAWSNLAFRTAAEEVALGLLALGLNRGDRVALVMQSDVWFGLVDMGCLLAGLVDVPIDLTQTIENIQFILRQTTAHTLVISNLDLLAQLTPHLGVIESLQYVIVVALPGNWMDCRQIHLQSPFLGGVDRTTDECLQLPHFLNHSPSESSSPLLWPSSLRLLSLDEVRHQGSAIASLERLTQLRSAIAPTDLATILYIASATKQPKGVMLSHENITADILAAFSSYPNLGTGSQESTLLFLPLTHIFARSFFYGHMAYGHSIYFSDPNHLVKHLKTVNPTILITVPRLLEKIYDRILEQGRRLSKFDQLVFNWAVKLAQRYRVNQPLSNLYRLQLNLADRWVLAKWRRVFGNRIKAVISGGAALSAELTTVLSAAGIPVMQGYGLTETSAVLCYNRGQYHRAGTVGVPIPGVELTIAPDGEVLVRAPFVMQGYYHDEVATRRVLEPDGWLHTGDLGTIDAAGFLTLTGVKKPLFKLATGKYVSALLLEEELKQSPLVAQAMTVGANQKFCGMLIFPNFAALQTEAQVFGLDVSQPTGLQNPCILALYQALIDTANCHLPYWATVRQFVLIPTELTIANGLLQPDGRLNRACVLETFASDITRLYGMGDRSASSAPDAHTCPELPTYSCPIYARSLTHY